MEIINLYRKIAVIEGISYLILLLVAMPLKYFFNLPEAVKYFGWIHGVLFLMFFVVLILAFIKYRWTWMRLALYLLASVVPVLPFILDKQLAKEYPNT